MNIENNHLPSNGNIADPPFSHADLSPEIKRKLKDFEQGDITSLDSVDIITIIAQHIYNLYNKGDMSFALILLENLGEWSRSEVIEHRERSLMVLSLITEKVLAENNEDFLEALSGLLIRWLKYETEYLAGFEFICLQLKKMVHRMLHRGLWHQSEDLIIILYKIKKGVIKKNKVFTQVIARIHSSLAEKELLQTLTETYINEQHDKREVAGALLANFADKSASHMLVALCNSPDKNKRFSLIEIIPSTGSEAIPILVKLLRRKPPWYIIRNIILILSKLSDPSLFRFVRPFMNHQDMRVQQEAIECARTMDGNKMVDRLLDAFEVCNDKFKPQLIRILKPLQDERIGLAFSGILKNPSALDQPVRDEIVREICGSLTSFPSLETMDALENFVTQKSLKTGVSTDTLSIAESTFLSLKQDMGFFQSHEESTDHHEPFIASESEENYYDPLIVGEIIDDSEIPAILIAIDEDSQPVSKEGSSTKESSTEEDWNTFSLGENWLTQTIKSKATPPPLKQHLLLRNEFYQQFREDEFSAFLSYLTHKTYKPGDSLVEVGDVHSNLYFIDSGRVKLIFPKSACEFHTRELQDGDIFGNDVFMSGSEWDVSLVACSESEVYIFDQEQLLKMQLRFPELALKILHYCKQHDVILNLLRMTEKRQLPDQIDEKIPFTGNSGEPIANIELVDITTVGFSFCLNLPKGFSPTLFADKMVTGFFSSESDSNLTVDGEIVGLQFFESDSCKLYIFAKFTQHENLTGYSCTRVGLQ